MGLDAIESLYGKQQHPYYIYAPSWRDYSAGIRSLHYLCHTLNVAGEKAFLVLTDREKNKSARINIELNTPILTKEILQAHFKSNSTPIVIYSETVPGNPLRSECVVRYLMNYAGALGGQTSFDENELKWAFSKNIATDYSLRNSVIEPPVLFLPPVDPREFTPTEHKLNYQIVYAGKYRSFVGEPPKVGSLPSVEIFRDGTKKQDRAQVVKLLSEAKVVYAFENTSLVTESILSGTPAVFIENEFLGKIIAEHELGSEGMITNESELGKPEVTKSIEIAIERYYEQIPLFIKQLDVFILETQNHARKIPFNRIIAIPNLKGVLNSHRFRLGIQLIKYLGLKSFFRVTKHFFARQIKRF